MHRLKRILNVSLVICLTLLLSACTLFKPKSSFRVEFIDVGQGDCALIESDGHYMLIDGGPKGSGEKVRNILVDKNITHLDILAVSHIHEDHIGGLPRILSYATEIDLTLCPQDSADSTAFNDFYTELTINNANITIPKAGEQYEFGKSIVKVLEPGKEENSIRW